MWVLSVVWPMIPQTDTEDDDVGFTKKESDLYKKSDKRNGALKPRFFCRTFCICVCCPGMESVKYSSSIVLHCVVCVEFVGHPNHFSEKVSGRQSSFKDGYKTIVIDRARITPRTIIVAIDGDCCGSVLQK